MPKENKKLLYLFDARDWKTRLPVADAAIKKGYNVILILVGPDEPIPKPLIKYNPALIKIPERTLGKRSLLSFITQLSSLIKEHKPDILHCVTLKYAFAAGLTTALNTKLKRIYTLAGLGYLFRSDGKKAKLFRTFLRPVLKSIFLRKNVRLIFQNPDDKDLFINQSLVKPDQAYLIRGSGVDLETFTPDKSKKPRTPPLILLPTRLVKEKGIDVFIIAAKILQKKGIKADYRIAGAAIAHNPKALNEKDMEKMLRDSPVEWLGRVEDMPALYKSADLIVYPSSYGEGIPRVLLEAAASGLPIITTDHPGCREAVENAKNGLLIPVKDPAACARAIEVLINNPQKRKEMGAYSRKKAKKEFDIDLITRQTVKMYEI